MTVTNAQGTSDSIHIGLASFQPAFFTLADEYVAAIRADGSVTASVDLIAGLTATPIKPGETVVVYGTGFGATTPETAVDEALQAPLPLANAQRIWMDTREMNLAFAALVSCRMGTIHLQLALAA